MAKKRKIRCPHCGFLDTIKKGKREGVNIALISESLGHSNIQTTQIYLDSFENSQIDEAMKHLL